MIALMAVKRQYGTLKKTWQGRNTSRIYSTGHNTPAQVHDFKKGRKDSIRRI